jgi:hypothetical protein
MTEPVGLDKIQAATVKRKQVIYDLSGDDECGTHRADTVTVERKRKRKMGIVASGGKEVDVLEVCGDLTEEDLEKQAEEIGKHKERKVGGGEKKDSEERDDNVMTWTEEDFMRYDRYLEEMNKEGEN